MESWSIGWVEPTGPQTTDPLSMPDSVSIPPVLGSTLYVHILEWSGQALCMARNLEQLEWEPHALWIPDQSCYIQCWSWTGWNSIYPGLCLWGWSGLIQAQRQRWGLDNGALWARPHSDTGQPEWIKSRKLNITYFSLHYEKHRIGQTSNV